MFIEGISIHRQQLSAKVLPFFLSPHTRDDHSKSDFHPLVLNWLTTDANLYEVSAIKEILVTHHHTFLACNIVCLSQNKVNMQK